MSILKTSVRFWFGAAALGVVPVSFAQTDEIQVYNAEIAEQGIVNLLIHTNYTPIGRKTAIILARSFRTTR